MNIKDITPQDLTELHELIVTSKDPKDAVSDAITHLISSGRTTFESKNAFFTSIQAIVADQDKCSDYITVDIAEAIDVPYKEGAGITRLSILTEMFSAYMRQTSKVTDLEYNVLLLRREGKSIKEISKELNVPYAAVKSVKISSILSKLKKTITNDQRELFHYLLESN